MFDFDKHFDRYDTNSLKYDFASEYDMPSDVKPMWIADMDFLAPPSVIDALKKVADHGIYGYTGTPKAYYDALSGWFETRHGLKIPSEWVVETPGVVFALNQVVRAFTDKGDAVIIQRPVYYPFSNAVNNNSRRLINNPLKYENGGYSMDLADFEKKIVAENVKLFILCNPHNPVGRVWTKKELEAVGEICLRHGVLVVSDDIHCDFTYGGNAYTPFVSIDDDFKNNCVMCTAPSKTFNIAGMQASNIIIPNGDLRKRFKAEVTACGYELMNIFAVEACKTAYESGAVWLDEALKYIERSYVEMRNYIETNMKKARIAELEGTYLAWVDFNGYGYSHEELVSKIVNGAKVWLDDGVMFGEEGNCFMRFNIACPRAELLESVRKIKENL